MSQLEHPTEFKNCACDKSRGIPDQNWARRQPDLDLTCICAAGGSHVDDWTPPWRHMYGARASRQPEGGTSSGHTTRTRPRDARQEFEPAPGRPIRILGTGTATFKWTPPPQSQCPSRSLGNFSRILCLCICAPSCVRPPGSECLV